LRKYDNKDLIAALVWMVIIYLSIGFKNLASGGSWFEPKADSFISYLVAVLTIIACLEIVFIIGAIIERRNRQ
jgi:hypothetical protein